MKTKFVVIVAAVTLLALGANLGTLRWRYWRQWSQLQGALAGGAVGTLVGYTFGRTKK